MKKNVDKVVLSGSENWVKYSTETNDLIALYYSHSQIVQNVGISDYFVKYDGDAVPGGQIATDYSVMSIFSTLTKIVFPKSLATTLEEFKTWLSNNNVTIYRALTLSTNILLNDTLQTQLDNIMYNLPTYAEKTYISQINDDLPFIIEATYFTNTINGKYAATLDQLNNIYLKLNEINSDIGNISSTLDEINGEEV